MTGIHGGLARYDATHAADVVLDQASPQPDERDDEPRRGRTWPVSKVVHEGPASYSDLAVTKEKTIVLIYEGGQKTWNEYISVARFNREWLVQ